MGELKTIAEMIGCNKREGSEITICPNCGMNHTISEEALKDMVIKWIKDIFYTPLDNAESKDMFEYGNERLGATKILKHIFNISEEDLKFHRDLK